MKILRIAACSLLLALPLRAAERVFDFDVTKTGELPTGWVPFVTGGGKASQWEVVQDDVPLTLAPLSPNAPTVNKRAVVAQLSRDPTDERYPMLMFDTERYGDFTFTTRLKIVEGSVEQIAGVAFRIQDEKNYYVVRLSALGNNLRFYKFVNGQRSPPIGPEMPIKKGVWHELAVQCLGNRIDIRLNGQPAMPTASDNSFARGKIGFFTKSDTIAYFADARVSYRPLEMLAATLVREAMKENPRILNLRIYGRTDSDPSLHVLASNDTAELGQKAGDTEANVLQMNQPFYGKEKNRALITYPLHDRNGEAIGAVKFTIRSFKGQTEANAMARVMPIVKEMREKIAGAADLTE